MDYTRSYSKNAPKRYAKKDNFSIPEVIPKLRQRDMLKRKFNATKDEFIRNQHKKVHNETNNLIN